MIIANAINFDNTLQTKIFANSLDGQKILNEKINGHETQKFKVGQTVDGNGHGFNVGIITDIYKQCGYIYYVIEYKLKPKARKTYKTTLRQKDIVLIWIKTETGDGLKIPR